MGDSRSPTQATGYHLERMDGEVLLHHPGSTTVLYLNETASLIWQICDGQRTMEDVAALLQDAFPETDEAIAEQVELTVRRFVEYGAIVFA